MKRVIDDQNTQVPVKIWTHDLELEAEKQLRNIAQLPFLYSHIAVMPDVHAGKGSTIGTVIASRGVVIPAAVGVDIGCGMCAVRLPFTGDDFAKDSLIRRLRHAIERSIPTGRESHGSVSARAAATLKSMGQPVGVKKDSKEFIRAAHQIGTLGGGNHFIELCLDESNQAWVMLHSGSRNIGKTLAEKHILRAKLLMKELGASLADPDLAYFLQDQPEFKAYIHDLYWAQDYAKANRNEMMLQILKDVSHLMYGEDRGPEALTQMRVDCHHNYCQLEHHFGRNVFVTRKGAVSAREGELGIIPGSMGARSFIVRGLGNPESFHSCSHGAGRRMSRTKARATFSIADLERETKGIECRKDAAVIDEIPSAYKDIDEVMQNQRDLVEPIHTLRQFLCIKGA